MRSPELAALGVALVVLGIVFSSDQLISYSFMGTGVLLSIISTVISKRKAKETNRTGGV